MPPVFGELQLKIAKDEAGGEETDVPKGGPVGEVEEIWCAVIALDVKLRDLVDAIKINQVGVMDHLWLSIARLRSFVDQLHTKLVEWCKISGTRPKSLMSTILWI